MSCVADLRLGLASLSEFGAVVLRDNGEDEDCLAAAHDQDQRGWRESVDEAALEIADGLLVERTRRADAPLAENELDRSHLVLVIDKVQYNVPAQGLLLGRDPGLAGSSIVDTRISRRHLFFESIEDVIVVSDLGSTNGSWIIRNGKRLAVESQPAILCPGDKIITVNEVLLAEVIDGDIQIMS